MVCCMSIILSSHLFIYIHQYFYYIYMYVSVSTICTICKYIHSLATWEPNPNDLYMSTLPAAWTFIGVGASVGMLLLLLVLSLVVVLIVVVVVVRRRAAHKQKSDPKMGGNLDPNSIEMQEKETGADTHYMDAHMYENEVKSNGELEDRVNDSYYSYVPVDMYVSIQNKSAPSVEESSAAASVTDGVYVIVINGVTDTGHYDVPRRMGNMTETGNGGSRSGNVEKEGYYYNVVDLRNEALANQ